MATRSDMASIPAIVSWRDPVEEQRSRPEPGRLISGSPELSVWNHYADPSGQFFAGVWAAGRGCWRIAYSEYEFCLLLQGRVRLSASDGRSWEFGAGDSFVVPAGFQGTWEVIEDCRKLYALFEPRSPAAESGTRAP